MFSRKWIDGHKKKNATRQKFVHRHLVAGDHAAVCSSGTLLMLLWLWREMANGSILRGPCWMLHLVRKEVASELQNCHPGPQSWGDHHHPDSSGVLLFAATHKNKKSAWMKQLLADIQRFGARVSVSGKQIRILVCKSLSAFMSSVSWRCHEPVLVRSMLSVSDWEEQALLGAFRNVTTDMCRSMDHGC